MNDDPILEALKEVEGSTNPRVVIGVRQFAPRSEQVLAEPWQSNVIKHILNVKKNAKKVMNANEEV